MRVRNHFVRRFFFSRKYLEMHCCQVILTLFIVVLTRESLANPAPPVWPASFQEAFNETSTLPIIGTSSNITGTYYYDFTHKTV